MSETVLEVRGLCKRYPGFALENAAFSMRKGEIMGLIGRNGAGKTTTLKSLLGLVHPDAGEIRFFGLDAAAHELEIKRRVGFVSGGANYYPGKRLKTVLDVTRRFYPEWDAAACARYMSLFALDENKQIRELSAGMQVKFALVLALSHRAELLILDEPTSGLDPVSREELLEVFLSLADEGVSILFSTHITSDREKCAESITYIRAGKIVESRPLRDFEAAYRLAELPEKSADARVVGQRRTKDGYTALLRAADAEDFPARAATLEEIMVHLEKEGEA